MGYTELTTSSQNIISLFGHTLYPREAVWNYSALEQPIVERKSKKYIYSQSFSYSVWVESECQAALPTAASR